MKQKKSKKLLYGMCALAIVALVAARCTAVHSASTEEESAADGAQIESVEGAAGAMRGDSEGEGQGDAGAAETDSAGRPAGVEPTEEQQALINAYDPDTLEAIDILRSYAWTTYDSAYAIQFGDCWYVESNAQGALEPVTFAVTTISKTQSTSDGTVITQTMLAMDTSDGGQIITISKAADAAGEVVWSIASDRFSGSAAYLRFEKATTMSVEGLSDLLVEQINGEKDALAHAVATYTQVSYPAATTATYERTMSIDEEAGTVYFTLMLNANDAPSIGVSYDKAADQFEVGVYR